MMRSIGFFDPPTAVFLNRSVPAQARRAMRIRELELFDPYVDAGSDDPRCAERLKGDRVPSAADEYVRPRAGAEGDRRRAADISTLQRFRRPSVGRRREHGPDQRHVLGDGEVEAEALDLAGIVLGVPRLRLELAGELFGGVDDVVVDVLELAGQYADVGAEVGKGRGPIRVAAKAPGWPFSSRVLAGKRWDDLAPDGAEVECWPHVVVETGIERRKPPCPDPARLRTCSP